MQNEKEAVFPDPPKHLSKKAAELYIFYVGLSIRAPGQIALLIKGLEALDQADKAGFIIRKDGLTQTSERSGLSRQHPLLNTQKEAIACFLKVWKVLGLDSNKYQDGFSFNEFV